ncbi:hypothetical protein H072_686 [Dactylellina haptotyla CBS 200.50]|uniref:Uncharacterized protein n=1 Tax=Dactylellina haptotyla (strain CBS 200.50) TaxID=1284197 RepID=S8AR20_DACHA|nr:hypothetical protein H072_686 [Dactylellina haptotyla CBS 200.50]
MTTDTNPVPPSQQTTSSTTASSAVPIPTSNSYPRPANLARTSSASSSMSGSVPNRHHRPSNVAELHQELEREQEGVVNRLLGQITRVAQNVAATHPGTSPDDIAAAAVPLSASPQQPAPINSHHAHPPSVTDMPSSFSPAIGRSRSPAPGGHHQYGHHHNTSHSRHNSLSTRSRTSSRTSSPLLLPVGMESSVWPHTANDPFLMGGRDEVAFYKAETDMLLRENEMLKRRIKELEDKTTGKSDSAPSGSASASGSVAVPAVDAKADETANQNS